jgi:hypothetical protein
MVLSKFKENFYAHANTTRATKLRLNYECIKFVFDHSHELFKSFGHWLKFSLVRYRNLPVERLGLIFQTLLQAATDLGEEVANRWIGDGVIYLHLFLAADQNAGIGQRLEMTRHVWLAQARSGNQLRNIFLARFNGNNKFQAAGLAQHAKPGGYEFDDFLG